MSVSPGDLVTKGWRRSGQHSGAPNISCMWATGGLQTSLLRGERRPGMHLVSVIHLRAMHQKIGNPLSNGLQANLLQTRTKCIRSLLLFQKRACAMFKLLFLTSCFMPIMFEPSSNKCLQDCKHSQAALQAKCLFTPWGNQYRTRQNRSSKSCETQDSFVPRGEAKALSSRVRLRISTLANCLSTGQLQLKEVKIRPRRPPSTIITYLISSPDRCLKETVVTTVMLEVAKLATDSNPHRPED